MQMLLALTLDQLQCLYAMVEYSPLNENVQKKTKYTPMDCLDRCMRDNMPKQANFSKLLLGVWVETNAGLRNCLAQICNLVSFWLFRFA